MWMFYNVQTSHVVALFRSMAVLCGTGLTMLCEMFLTFESGCAEHSVEYYQSPHNIVID
jgi:hypothetical protein